MRKATVEYPIVSDDTPDSIIIYTKREEDAPPLISCDPDTKQMAFAFFLGGICREMREFPLKPRELMFEWMRECQELVGADDLWLVIEDQWMGRNQKTLISLVEARMIVEMTAERLPRLLPVYRVHPVTWQKHLTQREGERRLTGQALQDRVKDTAEMLVHASIPSPHVCSAVCIGQWAVEHLKEYAYV